MKSMLKVDFKRMSKTKYFYIILACAFMIPIIMTVMLKMMDGKVTVNPQTGVETVMEGMDNVWQSIGPLPVEEGESAGGMDVMSMCNINMMFMLAAVFICLFVSDDFTSGYAKNLFTVRSRKADYVASKTIAGFVCGALMLILYFIGSMVGGAIAGISYDLGTLNIGNIVMSMMAKIFLMLVFTGIYVLISVAAKQKTWLAILGSLGGGMLMFMMIPMITPLNSTIINVIMCAGGGLLFSVGMGALSNVVLKKTRLV